MKNSIKKLMLGTVLSGFACGAAIADSGDLVIFDWSGYEDEGFFQNYVTQYGGPPTYAFFGEEEEAFQKLRAGFRADVSHPCSQSVAKWHEAGLLEPIDPAKITNWADVNTEMKEAFKIDGGYYMLPFDWGTTAVTYRADLVDAADIASLEVFRNPAYAGRMSLPDNVDDAYALGYLATGVTDWSVATDDDFMKASAWLREAHQNMRTYWADGAELAQLMTSGEVVVSWAWNETPTTMQAEGIDIQANRNTKEGSSSWFCGYVNLKDGPNSEDQMYDMLNALMDPSSADYIVNEWGYGHGNQTAMTALGPDALDGAGLGDVDTPVLAQIPMNQQLREKMIAEFELIKAGF
ncbi:spermidine/putrescine ABC transporter, periplasmic spermidine/putrescine-binding protein [Rhodobacterales bacterium HTCC2150]|nr:spermidine/putrescine ABC transporter, periplasmic spermidine/putrescine-binding protein [Rhodobacterales bacterium HTCC2150] [Rhodobacteraceae bacterium HTCC2150]